MALLIEVKRSRDSKRIHIPIFFFLFFNRSMITCSNFSQLFFAYKSSFFNFPHLLRLRTFFCLHLNFSGDTISLSLSQGSYLIQFTTVWWWLQCPRGLGLEISVKVHLME